MKLQFNKKTAFSILKVLISIAILYFVFSKIDIGSIIQKIKSADIKWLSFAFVLYLVSKYISVFRIDILFRNIDINLNHITNLKLMILGMFYNLFLPGGIGGDGYKGFWLAKRFDVKNKLIIQSLLLDRLNGMLAILILFLIIGLQIDFSEYIDFNLVFPVVFLIALGLLIYYYMVKYIFPSFKVSIKSTTVLSLFTQLLQMVSIYCILYSLGESDFIWEYQWVFLISSIVSVIPLTIGGIGAREMTFVYGASMLGLDESVALATSSIFFILITLSSLIGGWYHFRPLE